MVFLAVVLLLCWCSYSHQFRTISKRTNCATRFASPETIEKNVIAYTSINVSNIKVSVGSETARDELLVAAERLIDSLHLAMNGNGRSLDEVVDPSGEWNNPVVNGVSDLKSSLVQFSSFFIEPALVPFSYTKISDSTIKIRYQLSGWHPLPWRPRILVPGEAIVTFNSMKKVVSVREEWKVSLFNILLQQTAPRFWDVWHIFQTPSPEYRSTRNVGSSGKVNFLELGETVGLEVSWQGAAKYSGPPLQVIPGFALFGSLKTSRPNREPFYTVMPVEVRSGKFTDKQNGEDMKRSTWTFHVPTAFQRLVLDKAKSEAVFEIPQDSDDLLAKDDLVDEIDYQVGLQNLNVMKSVKDGVQRGNVELDEEKIDEFLRYEKREYKYKMLPTRYIATVDVAGQATPAKISEALSSIKRAVISDGKRILKKTVVNMKSSDFNSSIIENNSERPLLGLLLQNTKGCFNRRAEPAMTVYEIQFNLKKTTVFVELEVSE